MHKKLLLASAAGLLACASGVQSAIAAESATDTAQLETIVVTAQKKEQKLQDVGISITAFSAADLKQNNVKLAEDIVKAVPSLQYNAFTPGAVVFNIRGVAQNDYGDQQEPPVAVYFDDSYASSLNLSSFPVFDMNRVEVLRGPQGTLFGRNATGGAIQYVSNRPTKEFESTINVTAGRFRQFDVDGSISGPLTESLQGRLSFQRASNRGYLDNIFDGSHRGGQDNYALRGQLAGQVGENFDALLTVRYARNLRENNAGAFAWVSNYADPNNHFLGTPATPITPSPFGTCDGCDIVGYSNYAINPRFSGDGTKVALDRPSVFDRTLRGASARLNWHLPGGVDLVSISDVLKLSKIDLEDGDGGPLHSFNTDLINDLTQFTEELRASAKMGMHDWMVGLFFMHVNGHYDAVGDFASFGDYVTNLVYQQSTVSSAIFVQDEIKFADQWSLIAGVRYWRDKRKFDFTITDNFGSLYQFNPATYPGIADRTFKNYSAKLELDRKLANGSLLYLSWNRGTKSGGYTAPFFPPLDTSPAGIAVYAQGLYYNPEVLSATEVGWKATLFNGTTSINADAFYYDYKDYQAYVLYGVNTTIANLNAKEHGVELEVVTKPISGLTLSLGASSLRSRVHDVRLIDGALTERELPQAPTFSGHLSVRYEWPAFGGKTAAQWQTSYVGRTCFTALCGPIDVEAGHGISDVRLSYESPHGWDLALWANNVTDKVYRVFNSDTSFVGVAESLYAPPRWYGITVSVKFGGRE